jgi:hypothetical protein
MRIQAQVAADKQAHPDRFCPTPRCLWRTGGGYCERHAPAPRGEHEFVEDVVGRIAEYGYRSAVVAPTLDAEAQTLHDRVDADVQMGPIYIIDPVTGEREAL